MTFTQPVYEEVTIAHGGNAVTLRPTLRAAITLEARYGFPALFRALDDYNLTIVSDIILATCSPRKDAVDFLFVFTGRPLFPFFDAVREPLFQIAEMLMPAVDPKAKRSSGAAMPWPDYYAELYRAATGWLGWTPDQAWNATPTEIDRAHSAHMERLIAINGTPADEDREPDPAQAERNRAAGLDPEFDRSGLQALKMKIAGGA